MLGWHVYTVFPLASRCVYTMPPQDIPACISAGIPKRQLPVPGSDLQAGPSSPALKAEPTQRTENLYTDVHTGVFVHTDAGMMEQ